MYPRCRSEQGAGKSSIFRCLGGLWSIPKGSITKPGSAEGLNVEVFCELSSTLTAGVSLWQSI